MDYVEVGKEMGRLSSLMDICDGQAVVKRRRRKLTNNYETWDDDGGPLWTFYETCNRKTI